MTKRLVPYAKDLRKRSTDAELALWSRVRGRHLCGLKFRRQHPMGKYIVDFICLESKVIIELDGGQHADPEIKAYDRQRDDWLENEGYKILRFWDNDVLSNTDGIVEVIMEHCSGHPPLHPSPQGRGNKKRERFASDQSQD